ncbi:MAG: hypothetical protein GIKADHBN_03676 [Phycisphaerales bacterium]|nr:hypothetical protein [Phycisphaerales bacterium]
MESMVRPRTNTSNDQHAPAGRSRPIMRRGSARTIGLAVSAVTALAFVALVGYFYLRGKAGGPVVASASQPSAGQAPPDIRAAAPGQPLGAGKKMEIRLIDKRDPSRVTMRLLSESSEPQENARYLLKKPNAFIYNRSGVVYHVRADEGSVYMPNRQMQPEAASLVGNVLIRAYDEPPGGADFDPDAADIQPLVTFKVHSLQYDGTLGEVTTPDAFAVSTDQSRFTAVGLRVLFNQEQNRLEYCEIQRDGHLRYLTTGDDLLTRRKPKPEPKPLPPGTPPPPPKPKPVETFYTAQLTGGVLVKRGSQSIEADALDGWVRLVDNDLADDAIKPAPVRIAKTDPSKTKAAGTAQETPPGDAAPDEGAEISTGLAALAGEDRAASTQEPATPADAAETPDLAADPVLAKADAPLAAPPFEGESENSDVIELTWTGALVITATPEKPAQLARDQVAVRFTTSAESLCVFRDDAAGARGTASTIDYGATSQLLRMASIATDGVVLTADGSGSAIATTLSIDLGSGLTKISGPGALRDRVDRYITWMDDAEFQFHVDKEGMTSMIETASASGSVEAVQGASRLRASELTAGFLVGENRSDVFKLVLRGDAQAADGKGGELSAGSMDVSFGATATSKNPVPQTLDAFDDVLGQKDGASLAADSLHVMIVPGADGNPEVASVAAAGNARFTKAEEKSGGRFNVIDARSSEITAQIDAEIVELIGPGSSVGNLTSRLTGDAIRIDGMRRIVDVFGAGRFEHRGAAVDSGAVSEATVTWNRSVTYDDESGIVECQGAVVATNTPDAFTLQTLRADRARLELEPLPEGSPVDPDAPPRRLLRAFAWGSGPSSPAQLETRSYERPFAAGRERPSRVAFLEGRHIIADDDAGTLEVPGSGRMYFSDRRRNNDGKPASQAAEASRDANPFGGGYERGDARFIWQDRMHVDRRLGIITIAGKSNLRHVRLSDGGPTDIEADLLVGRFRNMQVSEAQRRDLELRAEFLGADAAGNVWIRSIDNKELVADRVEYDAESSVIKAMANEGNSVVYFDPAQGVPQRARVLYWDRTSDRIEIKDAGTIVLPK